MPAVQETVDRVRRVDVDQYRYGFETLIESDKAPKGLSEDTVRFISAKKNEPAWMLEWRLEAYRRWLTMTEPTWARVDYPRIDYQDLYYYSAPKPKKQVASLEALNRERRALINAVVPSVVAVKTTKKIATQRQNEMDSCIRRRGVVRWGSRSSLNAEE